jgi:short-subunit dehydrogenase
MIERRRGHIVGISSFAGKTTFPHIIAYASSKHGVTGFMNALYDEICYYNHDEFIKLTTVYPNFINTRKELSDILNKVDEFTPRMSPEYVAQEIVQGILRNTREIHLPYGSFFLQLTK